MPKESIQHLYNLPGPWGWEKMQTYRNEKLSPSPLTAYSADRLTAIGLVWMRLLKMKIVIDLKFLQSIASILLHGSTVYLRDNER